ncbi:MAG: Leucyl/phenylalanyl-tRNA--protein transferase [uncultured Nocardioidaceae bacterium]|uniref:Leucyl/phenylalanyl-tRNA--protein transferase n=1 Tax=uncultured Nocardioidaceae bacterium TaxID=253824 RepID=A0A6J4L7R6_9ACTN|nr:MAG: Leucyl/phenylalanyl-tRNA--protein transferase [uncultured Nocardioidaceae bacterium]
MPVSLPSSTWSFDPTTWPENDWVAHGADLEPSTLLAAYTSGAFPMPLERAAPMAWWSPLQRGVLPLASLRVSRSLRRACRNYEVRIDTAFADVVRACADPRRPGGWIQPGIAAAYVRLHQLGWAHSVESWVSGRLVGGLYGVAVGGLFAGESMFHRLPDASKVALVGLVDLLRDEHADDRLVDVQWQTPHLASLGAVEWDRADYLSALPALLDVPLPARWR